MHCQSDTRTGGIIGLLILLWIRVLEKVHGEKTDHPVTGVE